MENRYSMGEATRLLGLKSKNTLYLWEKHGKISPAKRIARSNYRFYTDADIARIREWMDRVIDPAVTSSVVQTSAPVAAAAGSQ